MEKLPDTLSPCANVRRTAHTLMTDNAYQSNRSVSIDEEELLRLARNIANRIEEETVSNFSSWDEFGWHYVGKVEENGLNRAERVAMYVLALDALNFCFWPTPDRTKIPYEHLAVALKKVIEDWEEACDHEDSFPLSPQRLAHLTVDEFNAMLANHMPVMLPEMNERCRLLNELGFSLIRNHEGSALKMIQKANQSGELLVSILIDSFPGFRDACVDCLGRQAFFYKRAQIAVADLWAAFKCLPDPLHQICNFVDMSKITTFAVSLSCIFIIYMRLLITINITIYFRTIVFPSFFETME